MKFDISMESDVNNLTARSIYQNEYMMQEQLSLEAAADDICGIISEEEEIANETFMETFRKIKAFIIAVFRKIINVIKMWWKKKAIKRLGKVLRNRLAPLSLCGQLLWLVSVISRNSIKEGVTNDSTVQTSPFTSSALALILLVCSSGDFYVRMTMFKRMIKDTSVSDMEKTVRGFRQWLSNFPTATAFIRRGGIFSKDNFTKSSGVEELCQMASKNLGIDTQIANVNEINKEIANLQAKTTAQINADVIQIDTADSIFIVLAKQFTKIMLTLQESEILPKNSFKAGDKISLLNVFAVYNKLDAKTKVKVDNLITSAIGDVKPLTKGDANMIEKSLTELVDFYNLFTLKAMHFMDRLEPDDKESLRPIITISKEMLHQIFAVINYCNYIVSDIDMTKYDIDLASDNSIVDEILSNDDDISYESYDDISDEEFDFDID